jgi:hypothetical protein
MSQSVCHNVRGTIMSKQSSRREFVQAAGTAAALLAGVVGSGSFPAHADDREDSSHHVKTVFVIAMENHNWTQPSSQTSPKQIFQNPATPFLNSLVNGSSGISNQVAFANGYINSGVGVHPSEPNYIWTEAGTNFGVLSDADPYTRDCAPDTVQDTNQHLSAFLTLPGGHERRHHQHAAAAGFVDRSAFQPERRFCFSWLQSVQLYKPVQLRRQA